MHFPSISIPISIILFHLSITNAQSIATYLSQIPLCALDCIAKGAVTARCGSTDYECVCGTAKPEVIKNITPCIATGCTIPDALTAQKNAVLVCGLITSRTSNFTSTTSMSSSIQSSSTSSVSSAAVTVLSGPGTKTAAVQTSSVTSSAAAATSSSPGEKVRVTGGLIGAGLGFVGAFVL
ncbi:hypothetical protein HYALB_00013199 [Hymenoscyphus albidus]|uniref:CFEM domain-containing protein n=1 Tax=Hymenoscyphus albidus TaxID=595503 RepID=A0A9N9Q3Y8_9HELO|nr:hypothetical protein HYALB_00013199 [Hymenoscyphus albidus]